MGWTCQKGQETAAFAFPSKIFRSLVLAVDKPSARLHTLYMDNTNRSAAEPLESPRYQLTEVEDMIAACVGHAYKAAQMASKDSDAKVDGVWDLKDRLELELSLMRPTFNHDVFTQRIQHHFELANGF